MSAERTLEYNRVLAAEKLVTDENVDYVHDAILTHDVLPEGYSAEIYDSYSSPYLSGCPTLVHVTTPSGQVYDIMVSTYKPEPIGPYNPDISQRLF